MQRTAEKNTKKRDTSRYIDNVTASLHGQVLPECQNSATLGTYASTTASYMTSYMASSVRRLFSRTGNSNNESETPAAIYNTQAMDAILSEIKSLKKSKKNLDQKIKASKIAGIVTDETLLNEASELTANLLLLDSQYLTEKIKKWTHNHHNYQQEHEALQQKRNAHLANKNKLFTEAQECLAKTKKLLPPMENQLEDTNKSKKTRTTTLITQIKIVGTQLKKMKQDGGAIDEAVLTEQTKLQGIIKKMLDNKASYQPIKPRLSLTGKKIAKYPTKKFNAELQLMENEIKLLLQKKTVIDEKIALIKSKNLDVDTLLTNEQLGYLEKADDILIRKVELSAPLIREHAAKRTDLLFLLGVAIYKKNVTISKGSTNRQHGIGSKLTGTAACHVSIIPNAVINAIDTTQPLTSQSWLGRFFKPGNNTTAQPPFSLTGTYLEDILNATTETLKIVNDFDGHMEGKFEKSHAVKSCISALNRCAKGEINPIELLYEYGKVMNLFYQHMEYKYVLTEPKYTNSGEVLFPKSFKLVWKYEREGFLCNFDVSANPKWEYIYMMLSMPLAKRTASLLYSGFIENRILEMQTEMLATKSQFQIKHN